jgi:hypothetical protein
MSKTTIPAGGLASDSVTTAKIADDAVTAAKAGFSAGKILQVVNAVNGTVDATTSSTLADTSLTLNITPSATSSTILAVVKINSIYVRHEATSLDLALFRDSTQLVDFGGTEGYNTEEGTNDKGGTAGGITYLDSPSSTSQLTYKVKFASSDNSNQIQINNYIRGSIRPKSSITLMEIAG